MKPRGTLPCPLYFHTKGASAHVRLSLEHKLDYMDAPSFSGPWLRLVVSLGVPDALTPKPRSGSPVCCPAGGSTVLAFAGSTEPEADASSSSASMKIIETARFLPGCDTTWWGYPGGMYTQSPARTVTW